MIDANILDHDPEDIFDHGEELAKGVKRNFRFLVALCFFVPFIFGFVRAWDNKVTQSQFKEELTKTHQLIQKQSALLKSQSVRLRTLEINNAKLLTMVRYMKNQQGRRE